MTHRLYYTDATLTEFDAQVVAINGTRVTLDKTAFYPTSGGQQFDVGVLGGSKVVDVIDEEESVVHVLEAAPAFAVGATVRGKVDWTRRFDHMQQHTGQHLLSALLDDMMGANTASVHFGEESATIDVDGPVISRDKAVKLETRANAVIAENRPVSVTFEDAASAAALRKPSDRTGLLRIVTIADIDRSACGGTHVAATGQIGALLIRRLEKYKNLTRVEFICGARAATRARRDYDALGAMAAAMSAGIDELPALVPSQAESLKAMESERRKMGEALAVYRIRELREAAESDAAGRKLIVHRGASADELRALAQAATALTATRFVGSCDSPATVVYAASEDCGINAGAVLKAALTAHGGKGGGSPKSAQGTAPSAEAIAAVVKDVVAGQ
jgi:alanyl-tRNA synthetase